MIISIVAAIGHNRVIGIDNKLPWNLPADIQRFRQLTMGKPVIMGRKTFESIGKPLLQRVNIVLTRDPSYQLSGCIVVHSIAETLQAMQEYPEVMVIGGEEIFRQFLPFTARMYLTLIHGDFIGDTYFPEFDLDEWEEVIRINRGADEKNPHRYTFLDLKRRRKSPL